LGELRLGGDVGDGDGDGDEDDVVEDAETDVATALRLLEVSALSAFDILSRSVPSIPKTLMCTDSSGALCCASERDAEVVDVAMVDRRNIPCRVVRKRIQKTFGKEHTSCALLLDVP
jgi:hypothetical protein